MPKNGTVAYVTQPKLCDFHKRAVQDDLDAMTGDNVQERRQAVLAAVPLAEYDFRTSWGSWANGCEEHWVMHRMYEELGIGKGQKLEAVGAHGIEH